MLPFMKPKHQTGIMVAYRKPDDEETAQQAPDHEELSELEICAEDLIRAIHSKDAKAVSEAFKDLFEICEMHPHDEYDHEEAPEGEE